ncbi:MAG: alanine racemase [Candidatus Taylorbacteria bacterium RIFCSPLOWO2_02_FULL_43_22b]|nr:MAG: alanine racemase [Candidatus Taylorbacteria bacterium RIFCSPHIGHO2_12_FULL_42_34]OHA38869.1 MAG: alanine racemase [Candidatus Taylorbacteria bacterium RIFCSPLOWO2_02_FULL_43_22b]
MIIRMIRAILRLVRSMRSKYTPLLEISLSRQNIIHNLRVFQNQFKNAKIAPTLKSRAYGHGLIPIAKILDEENLPFFVIDSYHEALILRNEGIRTPILIIGYTRIENIRHNKLKNISFAITSFDQLKELARSLTKPARFHLKIDTGMGRQGIKMDDLNAADSMIKSNPNIILEGIMSHLADADNMNQIYTKEQIIKWNGVANKSKNLFPTLKYFSLSNSAGYFYSDYTEANLARVGLGLYGIKQNTKRDKDLDLRPVLEMKTIISGLKKHERGDKIGYNGTFEVKNPSLLAILPLGYSEGLDRRLSNRGFVKVRGKFCPIVGNISMNLTIIDVTNVPNVAFGDEVTVISRNPDDENSVENISIHSGTIDHEFLAHIPHEIRRKIVE